jgi:hypothetical protein
LSNQRALEKHRCGQTDPYRQSFPHAQLFYKVRRAR